MNRFKIRIDLIFQSVHNRNDYAAMVSNIQTSAATKIFLDNQEHLFTKKLYYIVTNKIY